MNSYTASDLDTLRSDTLQGVKVGEFDEGNGEGRLDHGSLALRGLRSQQKPDSRERLQQAVREDAITDWLPGSGARPPAAHFSAAPFPFLPVPQSGR